MRKYRENWMKRGCPPPWIAAVAAMASWVSACTSDRSTTTRESTPEIADPGSTALEDGAGIIRDPELSAAAPAAEEVARCSGLEDCDNGSSCYRLTGVKWCQVSSNGNAHWTPVNFFNHTGLGSVNDTMNNWNFPPAGPANTLLLQTDGVDNFNHDIDVFTVSVTDWWWGWSFYDSSSGCLVRQSGGIKLNTFRMPNTAEAHILTEQHEVGHEIGLGHVCACPQVMDPCFNCSASTLTTCDAQGAAALYH